MKKKDVFYHMRGLCGNHGHGFSCFCAYHHEGEHDSTNFTAMYPDKTGTKLDHCVLCHTGGQYEKKPGKWVSLGSCQWCHHTYGYERERKYPGHHEPVRS